MISRVFISSPVLSSVHPKKAPLDTTALQKILATGFQPSRHQTAEPLDVQKVTRSGTILIHKKSISLPTLAVRLLIPGGSRNERPEELGLGALFSRLWSSGTKQRSSLQIAQLLESLGASINTHCGRNTIGLSVECLSKHWPILMPLLQEILSTPTFPVEEFETEKSLQLREILSERDSPSSVVHLNLMERLFANHPYGRSSLGTKSSVERLTREDCVRFYKENVHHSRLIASVVGDYRKPTLDEIAGLSELLPPLGRAPLKASPVHRPTNTTAISVQRSQLHQSHIMIGFLAPSILDPDKYVLKLLASALSGQGGRLFLELRDKQSLAYTVSPIQNDGPDAGTFSFYIGCTPEKWDRALRAIRSEIEKVLARPIPKTELTRAKQYWLGRFDLDMQRYGSQCFTFALDELYGMGFDHSQKVAEIIQSIDAKRIQEVASRYLDPKLATISIIHSNHLVEDTILGAWGTPQDRNIPKNQLHAEAL